MKSYSQFVYESYSARENLDEVAGRLAGKVGSRFIPGLQTAYGLYSGTSKLRKGDYLGAALGYGSALPGPLGWAFAGADIARELTSGGGNKQGEGDKESKSQQSTTQPPASQPPASQPPASQPPSSSTPTPKSGNVLAKKGGVEGVLDKSTGKWTKKDWGEAGRKRYQQARGAEQTKKDAEKVNSAPTTAPNRRQQIDKTIAQIKAKQDSGAIRNPFRPGTSSTTTRPTTPAPTTPSGGVVADRTPTPKKPTPVVTKPKQRFDIRDRDIRARASFDPRYDRR
jgi:hypothetical protein